MRVMRRYVPVGFDPSTGLDDVPAALPTGATWLIAVTVPPHNQITANKHRAEVTGLRTDSNTNFHHCAGTRAIRDKLVAEYFLQ
jgi:hypothetical protein